ncbi:MAG: hypothetical protein K2M76_07450, partial [Muribaculaceae bacterium]|nr:hypothetical protein [Muribaculaceae bacterium]
MVNAMDGNNGRNMLCSGEYFRLENDIDMSSYRYTPIAKSYDYVFDGIFDGNGHTISGLTINNESTYGGLIGRAGEHCLITNLTIKDADITAAAFAGCVVAWTTGDISNVNVISSTITDSYQGVGAIANIVGNITNCHADLCNITGTSGFVGGLVGQLNGTMANCSATNMRIQAGSSKNGASPVGGLIGLANYQSVTTDSYFSGTIDASYTYSPCITGGVAGLISGATVERCFAVGTIRGYSADAFTGGIAGQATSGTVIDCYVNGRVDGSSSRRTGGLIGFVNNGTLEGNVLPGTIRNCYSSATVTAETYLYNPETERRELFGLTADGAQYTIENVYFNKQLVNFGSTHYGLMTSDFISATGLAGFSADKWVFTEGQYPRIKGLDQSQAALYSASAL